jgi:hypothetical protein
MPRKLQFKLCPYCSTKILGVYRRDRKSFYYSPRCVNCARKALDPEVLMTRRRVVAEIRKLREKPIGATRIHSSGNGLFYVVEKTPTGWEYQHRLRTGATFGEHVHHDDRNGLNNDFVNLVKLTPKKHRIEHAGLKNRWALRFDECVSCGLTQRPHSGRGFCDRCHQRDLAKQRGHWPTRF